MRIKKISIKNYRSCIETVFEPHEHLSALIGPNGSGKTNVLSALRLLPALCFRGGHHMMGNVPMASFAELKTWYELDGKTIIHTAKLNIVNNEKNQDEIIGSEESWYLYEFTGKRNKISIPSWLFADIARENSSGVMPSNRRSHVLQYLEAQGLDSKNVHVIESVINFVLNISYYGASQFTSPGSCPISFEVEGDNKRRSGISITGHKKFLFDLYQEKRNNSDSYEEYINLVGTDGIGLVEGIDFNEIDTSSSTVRVMAGGKILQKEKKNLLIVPSFKVSGNSLSPSQLSEGSFKALAMIFYLVTDKSSLLMIEEPEVCVHHGLLSSIVELIGLYSENKQILISTHSDSVLDRLDIENVFCVKREMKDGTVVSGIRKNMKTKELSALKEYLSSEGSLGEYWKHGDLENA